MRKKIYVITGQTGTGKTKSAVQLASECNGELVNADSRQIYQKLDIVTGKDLHLTSEAFQEMYSKNRFHIGFYPVKIGQLQSKIWLYDIIDPATLFCAFDYANCAEWVLQNIFSRGKTPIFVGGSYLYIKHLLYGTIQTHVPPDFQLRKKYSSKSVSEVQKILYLADPTLFRKLNPSDKKNPHRLIRKIELAGTGDRHEEKKPSNPLIQRYDIEVIGLRFSNKDMHAQKIARRVEDRLKQGAVSETQSLLSLGYTDKSPGMKTIGYAQIIQFLEGKLSYASMIEQWCTKEIQYAKRQLTFMKKDPLIKWHDL